MIQVRYYLDISGGKPDTPTMTAAGYVAREDEWTAFGKTWSRILKDGEMEEFHATDFYACRKKCKHLIKGSPRHSKLESRFLNAARRHARYGFGLGFDVRTYKTVMTDALRRTKVPYGSGLPPHVYALSYTLNRAAQKVLPRGTITDVIFEHEQGIGAAIDYMKYLKNKRKEPWTEAYSSFTHMTKAERPLQAADLFAYHACFRIQDFIKDKDADPRPPFRKLMARPSRRPNIHLDASLEADFRATSATVMKFLEEHPDYAVED